MKLNGEITFFSISAALYFEHENFLLPGQGNLVKKRHLRSSLEVESAKSWLLKNGAVFCQAVLPLGGNIAYI